MAHASVVTFNAETMGKVMGATAPAFVKFDFPPCPLCQQLDSFWDQLGDAYPGLLYRVDCTRDQPVCAARSVTSSGPGLQPVFKFWTGSSFRRYAGEPDPKALVAYLQSKLTDEQLQTLAMTQADRKQEQELREQQQQQQRTRPTHAAESAADAEWRLRVLLATLAAGALGIYALIKYLGRGPDEQPAIFVVAGSYSQTLPHVEGRGDGLYLFRLQEADGSLTPVSCVGVGVPNLSYLCAEPPRAIHGGALPTLGCPPPHRPPARPARSRRLRRPHPRPATLPPPRRWRAVAASRGGRAPRAGLLHTRCPPALSRRALPTPTATLAPPPPTLAPPPAAPGWPGAYVLHAASEAQPEGSVLSLFFDPRRAPCLKVIDHISAGGGATCHVALLAQPAGALGEAHGKGPASPLVLAANYDDGSVAGVGATVDAKGRRTTAMARPLMLRAPGGEVGSKVVAERQASPHAHCCLPVVPKGHAEQHVLVADLGADTVAQYAPGAGGAQLRLVGSLAAPAGAGPRHLAAAPDGAHAYCVCELDNTVLVLRLHADRPPELKQRVALLAADGGAGAGAGGAAKRGKKAADRTPPPASFASAIVASRDGRHVYAAVRGADLIVALQTAQGGARLAVVSRTPSGEAADLAGPDETCWPAHTPRDIKLAGAREELLLAANQDSHSIASFRRDADTGALTRLSIVESPSPCCLLPLAWPPPA